jgi:hypothetical protein
LGFQKLLHLLLLLLPLLTVMVSCADGQQPPGLCWLQARLLLLLLVQVVALVESACDALLGGSWAPQALQSRQHTYTNTHAVHRQAQGAG